VEPLTGHGGERSFEGLYRRHRAEVYRMLLRELGNREDAEDVTQAAFLDAYRALAGGTEPARPRAWLLTIAENARRRRQRTLGRRPYVASLEHEPAAAERDVTVRELRDALERLPANQRAALVLRELGGLGYAEIAARLALSVASVQMLLFRARRALRAELEADAPRRRAGGWLWPFQPWLAELAARHALVPRAAGVAAAGAVGAAALTGSAAPPPVRAAQAPPPPAVAAPVEVAAVAPAVRLRSLPRPAAPTPRARPRARPAARPEAPAPAPPPAPRPEPPPPPEPPAPAVPQSPGPPAPSLPALAPPAVAPAVPAPPQLPAVELPPVPALPPLPAVESPVPTGDVGGGALSGLPTS
jgi:RNA polymerase sigma factor (sigma-70 family)